MANATAAIPVIDGNYQDTKMKYPLVGTAGAYYQGTMYGQDASGNVLPLDDTVSLFLVGIQCDSYQVTVDSGDAAGATKLNLDKPYYFAMKIASAAAGDEGKKVFAKFNNEVQYGSGSFANYVGKVFKVYSSTMVLIAPPWSPFYAPNGSGGGFMTTGATANYTLTKFDVNKTLLTPLTANNVINLPAAAVCSPGDRIQVLNTSATTKSGVVTPNGTDNLNGANTGIAGSTTQYAKSTYETDGVQWFKY